MKPPITETPKACRFKHSTKNNFRYNLIEKCRKDLLLLLYLDNRKKSKHKE
jgi:hypothetical protein